MLETVAEFIADNEVLYSVIEFLTQNKALSIPLAVYIITLVIKLPYVRLPGRIVYVYQAKTIYRSYSHRYIFSIEKTDNVYRCYIVATPSFRGRDTSRYMPHYLSDFSGRWICWTGEIKYPEQAKTLCRKWADATQKFIDTGIPAPGFTR